MAINEVVSAEFGHAGDCLESVRTGASLHGVCVWYGARVETRGSDTKYIFRDGSAILLRNGAWWDYGFEGCWCWDTEGHGDECRRQ